MADTSLFIVLSSPSGCGKTTMCKELLSVEKDIKVSISATTRDKRKGEEDGKDYLFITKEKFEEEIQERKFLEHAHIFGNIYGTPLGPVEELRAKGFDVLFDVDYQGAAQIKESAPGHVIRIFVLPPSMKELSRRLRSRGTETEEQIIKRLARAQSEIEHGNDYDYIIINDDKEKACQELKDIVSYERNKIRSRVSGQKHAASLLEEEAK
eukprot:m.52962 g.52962  ORF g.52962 m.52962 type:complete len:210 (-) comp10830_c0_seq1:3899-4528(-)